MFLSRFLCICNLVRKTSGGCVRKVAKPPAKAPQSTVSYAETSLFCFSAKVAVNSLAFMNKSKFKPENGASLIIVGAKPLNNPLMPSFLEISTSIFPTDRLYSGPPPYSNLVFTTVIGFNKVAIDALDNAPTENVIIPFSN